MKPFPTNAALMLIDVQKGFEELTYWGERNNPHAEMNMALLLEQWRRTNRPVIHVQHLSLEPNSPLRRERSGSAIKDEVAPVDNEPVFQKTVNSAFIGTGLEEYLRSHGLETLVIVGLTTPHCVSTSTRMAANLGFKTFLVEDATAAFALRGHDGRQFSPEEIHAVSLATLNEEFATILSTDEALRAL